MKTKKSTFRKSISALIALVLLVTLLPGSHVLATDQSKTRTYIVMTVGGEAYDNVVQEIGEAALSESTALAESDMLVAELTEKEANALEKDGSVLFIEEDFEIEANSTDDADDDEGSAYSEEEVLALKLGRLESIQEMMNRESVDPDDYEWNMKAVDANDIDVDIPAAEAAKIKVAVLDSGVDIVRGIELANTVNLLPDEQEITPMFWDMSGHGTAIASIIAGNPENEVQGVNPNAALYSVKVLDDENKAPVSRIIEGIYWCINNDMKIINMSFGTSTYSKALQKAIEDAYDAGILMIAAAGNDASAVEYPAAFPEVMAVAATGTDAQISDFSNTGDELEIAAPGEKIKAMGFFGGQIVTHGTSIAAPHVTGAASLLWEKDPSKSNEFIRQLLGNSTKSIENSDECGLLDVEFALELYDDFAANWNGEKLVRPERLPENNAEPETFEEVDDDENYVEGRWHTTNDVSTKDGHGAGSHEDTVNKAAYHDFTTTEVGIIKVGCTYPDTKASGTAGMTDFPEWHGYFTWYGEHVNYIACYEFVQKIALKGGDVSSFTSYTGIKGLSENCFDWIKSCFSTTSFGWYDSKVSYSTILASASYSSKSATTQKKYRELFIFGLSAHIIADTFAHSAYAKNSEGSIVRITHSDTSPGHADDIKVVPNRYECAKEGVEELMIGASERIASGWYDYAVAAFIGETAVQIPKGTHTFYVANILTHAKASGMPEPSVSVWAEDIVFINRNVTP